MFKSLANETDPDDVASLILSANDIAARQLYNQIQPYHPIYKARLNTSLMATLIPKQTLGIYSVEGSEKLMTAKQALGLQVIGRTREQVALLSTTKDVQLTQPTKRKLHLTAKDDRAALAYLNSQLPLHMTTVDSQPVRQELVRMAFPHFQQIDDRPYQFAYDTEQTNNPVQRFGQHTQTITYVPSYFVAGMDPMLSKVISNARYYWLEEQEYL